MKTREYRVSVGNPNIRINRQDYEELAVILGMHPDNIEEFTDSELQRIVVFKQLGGLSHDEQR